MRSNTIIPWAVQIATGPSDPTPARVFSREGKRYASPQRGTKERTYVKSYNLMYAGHRAETIGSFEVLVERSPDETEAYYAPAHQYRC